MAETRDPLVVADEALAANIMTGSLDESTLVLTTRNGQSIRGIFQHSFLTQDQINRLIEALRVVPAGGDANSQMRIGSDGQTLEWFIPTPPQEGTWQVGNNLLDTPVSSVGEASFNDEMRLNGTMYLFQFGNRFFPIPADENPKEEGGGTFVLFRNSITVTRGFTSPLNGIFIVLGSGIEGAASTVQGPKGDKGDRGEQGEQGIQGPMGVKGDVGEQGEQGERGEQGVPGVGSPGDMGSVGPEGPRGPQGIVGPEGQRGPQGIQGMKGDKGDTGDRGPTGLQGIRGLQGNTGPQGIQGIRGNTGQDGPRGLQGVQGIQGPIGPKGDTGEKGDKGDTGDTGPIGPRGLSGSGALDFVKQGGPSRATTQDFTGITNANTRPGISTNAAGCWSNANTMWVVVGTNDASNPIIQAYNLRTKARESSRDINIEKEGPKNNALGIWSNGTTMWVAVSNLSSSFSRTSQTIRAYNLSTRQRDSSKDINPNLSSNEYLSDMWSDGITLWVTVSRFSPNTVKVNAYNLSTRQRDSSKDIVSRLRNIDSYNGIWSDGTTIWISGRFGSTRSSDAYNLSTRQRDTFKDLSIVGQFCWYNGSYLWFGSALGDLTGRLTAYTLTPTLENASDNVIIPSLTNEEGVVFEIEYTLNNNARKLYEYIWHLPSDNYKGYERTFSSSSSIRFNATGNTITVESIRKNSANDISGITGIYFT